MDKQVKRRRGGPRTFNREEAIDIAMRLFWRHGYEGVSLNDLTTAIGIAPPSLYAAFGSKAQLYREALDRYGGIPGALLNLDAASTLDEVVATILRQGADAVTDPGGERGCMVSSGMLQCAEEHAPLALTVSKRRDAMRDAIAEALGRWLDPERSKSLGRFLAVVLQGMSVQARDGATRSELEEVIQEALRVQRTG
ncbi:transcriptional regulator, TetR family [Agrobacterium fabrum]|uniref:TetR/AcrR family transcriptional regulator n=1 Tax=Agrobacterium fabrum TaxID=1176649 RepID=UPI0008839DA6|nr:TetR/AcrR family transcriptional regulator [Agrobacterium fabrum]CAH0271598.1 HTH-type transcriptional repressor ComR [Agrobacterium fabrum]CAH0278098.1 HTH-type transcriptional repressor ComR [Agrobacterium fabrum]SDB74533.1 transcriptional regulator, TetR family [Agrobacterium fabrum]SES26013.1 transcriptional regulator, TetR family [Agrobacterium fabrum]